MTESWNCDKARISLGVYMLGAINPAERALVEAHLAACRDCRDELAGLAGLSPLLARLKPEDFEPSGDGDEDGGGQAEVPPELIGAVRALTSARRRRYWVTAAAAAAAASVAALASAASLVSVSPPPGLTSSFDPGPTTLEKVSGTSLVRSVVTVWYGHERWGTVLAVKAWGIPVGTTCELWAVHADGSRTRVTEWTTGPDEGKVAYWGGLSLPDTRRGIMEFQVTEGSKVLVTFDAS